MIREYEIWAAGRRGSPACITVTIYEHSIVATADFDKFTEAMMHRGLKKEFPDHTFYYHELRDIIHADADRWTDDGID